MPYRNAASVFPDPVGAWISVCSPEAIAGHPASWAGVGAANARSNHSLVTGEKRSSALTPSSLIPSGYSSRPIRTSVRFGLVDHRFRRELRREQLERRLGLRLGLAGEIEADSLEIGARLGAHLERLLREPLGRELEDPRAVRQEPHLDGQPAAELRRDGGELQHEDRPEDAEIVEPEALR